MVVEGDSAVAMQGMMMKKKTSTPSILRPVTLEWVTRHFFLYEDGKMMYTRDGASVKPEEMVLLCNNISACQIDRAKASDLGKKKSHVANSFYITVPSYDNSEWSKTHTRALLVTHGPEDFKKWITTFRRLKAVVNMEAEGHTVPQEQSNESGVPKVVHSEHSLEVSALAMSDVKFEDGINDENALSFDDEKQHVHFNLKDEIIEVPDTGDGSERPVIPDVAAVVEEGDIGGDAPESEKKVAVTFAIVNSATIIDETDAPVLKKKASVRFAEDSCEIAAEQGSVEHDSPKSNIEAPQAGFTVGVGAGAGALQSNYEQGNDEIAPDSHSNEGILYPVGCKGARVFAYGDSLDELTQALTADALLYGLATISLEETMDDETYANTSPQPFLSELKAFSIEYLGKSADPMKAEKFEQHLGEIISFCKLSSNLKDLHPIRCRDNTKVREEIVSVLQVLENGNEEEDNEEVPTVGILLPNLEYDSSSGLTAYKNALQTQDPADIPSGSQVLACVRQQMGVPYNWVLFQPSQTELIVEDAGSGGVIEMTKVLHDCYNDRVLFGLARVSFMGETFGRRQIWFGLEWSGEDCTSVKMIRQLRDCALQMTEFIGERSFTMTNVSATDMTPDAVCAWVKRSCDVTDYDLSVMSMNAAYIEEQKVIKEYYLKLAEKDAAMRVAREAKRKEQLRKERLWLRQETKDNMAPLRTERREKWSKMKVQDILQDLGNEDSLSGWVLLQIDI
eukprot:CCRYP_017729-RA/>CCRYP_017729-RA protein AED:0.14 eAED:-0.06 QI:0/0/0/1/1/1/2/0/734